MSENGIYNSNISWPRGFVSALPVIGIFMGCINQRHIFFDKSVDPINKAYQAFEEQNLKLQQKDIDEKLQSLRTRNVSSSEEMDRLDCDIEDLTSSIKQMTKKFDKTTESDSYKKLIVECRRAKVFSVTAIISHLLTLSILITLISLGLLSKYYLAISLINVIGFHDHYKAFIRARNIENLNSEFVIPDHIKHDLKKLRLEN